MKVLLFANTDWYLFNFRRSLAESLRNAGHEVLLVSPPGPYGPRLREMGFRWLPAPMDRRSLHPWRELKLLHWLWRLVSSEKVDLVHGFTIKCAVYGSMAARLAGVPARVNAVAGMGYVFTSRDARARLLRPLVRTLMRIALDGPGARLILQNPDDVSLFTQAGLVKPEHVRLIPGSGVNCRVFTPRTTMDHPAALRVLLPARLLWDKGIAEYVQAARTLRSGGSDIRFLVAGMPDPGNPASIPETTVRGWVAEGVIDWLGHVEDMPALFRSVDAVVLPSYREGLPKGLIEAGACALPLVTTDVPGCREVVTNERDGLLVPARDAGALASAISRLARDPDLRRRLGAAARETAMAKFDELQVIARTMDVYRELLPGSFRALTPELLDRS